MTQYEEGRYLVKITNQYFTEASTGTKGFVLTFSVLCNLEQPEVPVKPGQRDTVFWISKNNAKRALHDLQSLGYEDKDFKRLHPKIEGFHDFRDQEIVVVCEHKAKIIDGKEVTFESWNFEGGKPKLNPSEIDELDLLLNPEPKRTNSSAHEMRPPDAGEHGITDDDVPF